MSHRQQAVYWRGVGRRLFLARTARHLTLASVSALTHATVGDLIEWELLGVGGMPLTVLCHVYGLDPNTIAPAPPWQRIEEADPCGDLQIVPEDEDGEMPF